MVSFREARITEAPLAGVLGASRPLDPTMFEVAATFFG
jgi:hypothetical protein